jgi:hypothetical protein
MRGTMSKSNGIVILEISTWGGISFGAEHYYGKLCGFIDGDYSAHCLEYLLSEKEAKKFSKKDDWEYSIGDKCSRFETENDVKDVAILEWKKYFPNGKILLKGHFSLAEPMECLWASNEEYINKINTLWKYHKSLPRNTNSDWKKIYDNCIKFDKLLQLATQ